MLLTFWYLFTIYIFSLVMTSLRLYQTVNSLLRGQHGKMAHQTIT